MRFLLVLALMVAAVWAIWESYDSNSLPPPSAADIEFACQNKNNVHKVTHLRSGGWIITCKNETVRYVPSK